ncbi:MAG: hypothetical protein AB7O32_20085 [Vicinamibacterales bacterium]
MRRLIPFFVAILLITGVAAETAAQHHEDAGHGAADHAPATAAPVRKAAAPAKSASTPKSEATPKGAAAPKNDGHDAHAADSKAHAASPTAPAHGDSHGSDAAKPAHGDAASDASASQGAAGRRPASASELDAVLARISKKIADRKAGAAAARPKTTRAPAPARSAAPERPRVSLVWRPTVIWPVALMPLHAAGPSSGIGMSWPAAVDVSGTTAH